MATGRRKIAPIPLEIVTDHAGVIALPVSAYGMLLKLVVHFWQTDCQPLPMDNNDRLFSIAQAHRSTWVSHKAEILRIFNESAPALEHAMQARKNQHSTLAELRSRGHAAFRKRKLEKAIAASATSEPVPAPRRDQVEKQAPAAPGKGFTEKRVA
jgi:hypothetical protein